MTTRVDRAIAGTLPGRARGRIVVIDAYRSWGCGTWVGDVTARFADQPPGSGFEEDEPIEGVRVLVRDSLCGLLERAGTELSRRR